MVIMTSTFKNQLMLGTGLVALLSCFYYSSAQCPQYAISNDINRCLFHGWTSAGGTPVLAKDVECVSYGADYKGLCYALTSTSPTKFAVCYNKASKTPAFTGHVLEPVKGEDQSYSFQKDIVIFAPARQAEVVDYDISKQVTDFPGFDNNVHYLEKGQLTPSSDFGPSFERALTFILTNAAPQWQTFKRGNWASMENGIRTYVNNQVKTVYVFTGVGGAAKDGQGLTYKINKEVTAPQYYWKLICDPSIKEMIVYVGKNDVGSNKNNKITGCKGLQQTEKLGVMDCDSYNAINTKYPGLFKMPDMHAANCPAGVRGSFLDTYVHFF